MTSQENIRTPLQNIREGSELIRIYNYYRVTLSSLVLLMFLSRIELFTVTDEHRELFLSTATVYLLFSLVSLILFYFGSGRGETTRLFANIYIDIICNPSTISEFKSRKQCRKPGFLFPTFHFSST